MRPFFAWSLPIFVALGWVSLWAERAGATGNLPPEGVRKFLQAHCYDCHLGGKAEGGLDLGSIVEPREASGVAGETSGVTGDGGTGVGGTSDSVTAALDDRWVRIYERVRSGEMPPANSGELAKEELAIFLQPMRQWLESTHRTEVETSGRVRGRRLTNRQLERTLHDLLGIDIPLANRFSDEPRVAGFVSVAEGQAMSHFQLQQHLEAVDAALEEAFRRALSPEDAFDKTFTPEQIAQRKPQQRNREPELREGVAVAWSSRLIFYGRMAVTTVPEEGWYRFTITASSVKPPAGHGVWCSVRSGPCVSSAPLLSTLGGFEATPEPQDWTFEGWLEKGHMIEVRPADATLKMAKFDGGQVGAGEGEPQNVPGVAIHRVEMRRIHRGLKNDGVRQLVLGDCEIRPAKDGKSKPFAKDSQGACRDLVTRFARRAFRQQVTEGEARPYVEVAQGVLAEGGSLEAALRSAYRAILCSPRFLYFTEGPGRLDGEAVANRLSYFLWNRMPDEELMAAAGRGELFSIKGIKGQVQRMLEDPRGANFVSDFADQWLDLCDIDFTEPDPKLYRDYDPMVQEAMLRETRSYLQKMLDANLGVTYLVDSDFTFLNSRLARYYGIEGVSGDQVRQVKVRPEDHRGGLLTQGAILKVTANGTTTSPVVRGVWVSERLLGEHIPPPPSNVPAIEPDIRGATTIREQLQKHKADPGCASCHVKIDPPGFALESFDPSGKWRDRYATTEKGKPQKVDASYAMPDGKKFNDIEGFKKLAMRNPERLAFGLTEKLVTYATGAIPEFGDRPAIEQIVRRTADTEYGFRSLIDAVVTSPIFLSK